MPSDGILHLCFVDLETSGLDETKGEILEIGALRVDQGLGGGSPVIVDRLNIKVRPTKPVDPSAARVNKYTPEGWEGAVPLDVALTRLFPLLDKSRLAGWNIGFDERFLRKGYAKLDWAFPRTDYKPLDVASMATILEVKGLVPKCTLTEVSKFFGLDVSDAHSGYDDIYRTFQVYERISQELLLPDYKMPRVVIESPLSGDFERNVKYTKLCALDCVRRGEAPYASHLLMTQFLDDQDQVEREMGMQVGFAWGSCGSKRVVYTDLGISGGMRLGIEDATARGIPIEHRNLPEELMDILRRDEPLKSTVGF